MARAHELNLIPASHSAFDAPVYDNFSRVNVRFDSTVWADGQTAIREVKFPVDHAIHVKVFATCDFTFDPDALAYAGVSTRRCLRRAGR
jgi:hypothetical protein